MRHSRTFWLLLVASAATVACESLTDVIAIDSFSASLKGENVRPTAIATDGTGAITITLLSNSDSLTYDLSFSDLSTAATAVHIHGPAADTVNAAVLVDFASLPAGGQGTIQLAASGVARGTIDLKSQITTTVSGDSLYNLLHAGLLYVDAHTGNNSDGEIRGQIRKR